MFLIGIIAVVVVLLALAGLFNLRRRRNGNRGVISLDEERKRARDEQPNRIGGFGSSFFPGGQGGIR